MSATDVLREYAETLRADWSSIDGRTGRDVLYEIADAIERDTPSDGFLRTQADLCPHGHGHWTMYCQDDCDWAGGAR